MLFEHVRGTGTLIFSSESDEQATMGLRAFVCFRYKALTVLCFMDVYAPVPVVPKASYKIIIVNGKL